MSEETFREFDSTPPSPIKVLVWKQINDLLPLILVVLGLLAVAVTAIIGGDLKPEKSLGVVFAVLSIGLAAAIPILAFVQEKETGTSGFLVQLPLDGRLAGLMKLATCVVAYLLFLIVLCVVAALTGHVDSNHIQFICALSMFTLAASCVTSILTRNGLAAVIGAGTLVLLGYSTDSLLSDHLGPSLFFDKIDAEVFDQVMLVASVLLLMCATFLSTKWLRRPDAVSRLTRISFSKWPVNDRLNAPLSFVGWVTFCLVIICTTVYFLASWIISVFANPAPYELLDSEVYFVYVLALAVLLMVICGALVSTIGLRRLVIAGQETRATAFNEPVNRSSIFLSLLWQAFHQQKWFLLLCAVTSGLVAFAFARGGFPIPNDWLLPCFLLPSPLDSCWDMAVCRTTKFTVNFFSSANIGSMRICFGSAEFACQCLSFWHLAS